MGKRGVRSIFSWSLVVVWMGVIFFLSHQPASQSSDLSSGITETVIHILPSMLPLMSVDEELFHHFIRKSAHFTAYLLLGMLVLHALRKPSRKGCTVAFLISLLYAISDEFHQLFVPGRSGEIRDVVIDSMGAATGIGVYMLGILIIRRFLKR